VNREDIIRMAREAGIHVVRGVSLVEKLSRFAALIAAHEREACAKVCETEGSVDDLPEHYADAIRSRGEVQP
jgi:hypothetical protein